jgi:hypothetical protein
MSETIRFCVITLKDGSVHSFPMEDVDLIEIVTGELLWSADPFADLERQRQELLRREEQSSRPCSVCEEPSTLDDFGTCPDCAHTAPVEDEEDLPPTQTTLSDFQARTAYLGPNEYNPLEVVGHTRVHSGEMPEDVREWLANREAGILAPHPRPQLERTNHVRLRSCRRCGAQRRRCLKSLGYRCYSCLDLDPLDYLEDF